MNEFGRIGSTNLVLWRIAAWAGPVFILGILVFWGLIAGYLPAPPQDWSPAEITAKYTEHNVAIKVGMVGVLVCVPLYFVWSSVVSRIMQRVEGYSGVLANIELVAGAVTAITGMLFSACWLAAAFHITDRTPQDIMLMHDLGWMFFNVTFAVPLIQMLAFGALPFVDRRSVPLFPRWLGWLSFAAGGTFMCILLMPFVKNGPFSWNGLLTYWLVLGAYFLWMGLAMYFVFPAIRGIEAEDGIPEGAEATSSRHAPAPAAVRSDG